MSLKRFQGTIRELVINGLGLSVLTNKEDSANQVVEQALELSRSSGITRDQAHRLVDWVYNRPKERSGPRNVGGVMFALAIAAEGQDACLETLASMELENYVANNERFIASYYSKKKALAELCHECHGNTTVPVLEPKPWQANVQDCPVCQKPQ